MSSYSQSLSLWFEMAEKYAEFFYDAKLEYAAQVGLGECTTLDPSSQHNDLPCPLMQFAYDGVSNGYTLNNPSSNLDEVARYGEVTFQGVTQILLLLSQVLKDQTKEEIASPIVVTDFGSGVGKMCLQLALYSAVPLEVNGIELEEERDFAAKFALVKAKAAVSDDVETATKLERVHYYAQSMFDEALVAPVVSRTNVGMLVAVSFPKELIEHFFDMVASKSLQLKMLFLVIPNGIDPAEELAKRGRTVCCDKISLDTTWYSQAPAFFVRINNT
eukprot:PhF_6_TR35068/c0_g1_i1/m.51105